jgi:hypothetical protein
MKQRFSINIPCERMKSARASQHALYIIYRRFRNHSADVVKAIHNRIYIKRCRNVSIRILASPVNAHFEKPRREKKFVGRGDDVIRRISTFASRPLVLIIIAYGGSLTDTEPLQDR